MIEPKRLLDAEEKEFRRLTLYKKRHPDWMLTRNLKTRRPHLTKHDGNLYDCACGASDMKRQEAYFEHTCSQGIKTSKDIPDDEIDPRRKAITDADL